MCAVAGCAWSVVYYVKYRWRKEEEQTRQMYDMVERIIGKKLHAYSLTHRLRNRHGSIIITMPPNRFYHNVWKQWDTIEP